MNGARADAGRHEFQRRCRARGLRVTPQRLAIYQELLRASDHPAPEVLFRRLRRRMPSLSLATVYKALDALVDLGLVREVAVAGDRKRFDANLERHHHLVCTACRSVADLYDAKLDRVALGRTPAGFRAREVSVHVIGLCGRCVGQARLATSGTRV